MMGKLIFIPIMFVAGAIWLLTLPFAWVHDQCPKVLDPFDIG